MSINFHLTAEFKFTQPLHFGTGLSHLGVADRTIGLDAAGHPVLRGEAVKGAIRGSAERLIRWLLTPQSVQNEQEDHSLPPPGSLYRIFRGDGDPRSGPAYRFDTPLYLDGGQLQQIAATRIDHHTGVAANQSLRVLQSWTPGARFRITIRGFQGDWDQPAHRDYLDLTLLVAALVCADSAGGRKGAGHGSLEISALHSPQLTLPNPGDLAQIEALKLHLLSQEVAPNA